MAEKELENTKLLEEKEKQLKELSEKLALFEKKEILSPSLIKMDVEGAEYLALQGMEKILKEFHPIILLATHGEEIKKKCLEFLSGIGYSAEALSGSGDEYLVRPI